MKSLLNLIFVSFLVQIFVACSFAQDNPFLINKLKENSLPVIYKDGKLSGAGADFLFREAEKAQFFLIGEEHGIAENSLFASAVLQELNRFGYKYFASEIGKLTMARLEKLSQNKPVKEVLADFNRRYPFSLPFYNWKEEGKLMETALKLPRGKVPTIWGLDQEFFFSPVYHFERLRELALNAKSKGIVDGYYQKIKVELAKSIETKNPSSAFIVTAKTADFDKLRAAFSAKDTEANQILNDLQTSAEIYQKNSVGKIYENNLQRSRFLKHRFMEFYNQALKTEKMPKVFFKFGAAHVARGRNYVNVFDVGTLASEIADTNGTNSFHILILAAGGEQNKFFPFVGNETDKKKKLDPAIVYSYLDVSPFVFLAERQSWKVIELGPLRPLIGTKSLTNLPSGFADLIFNFDAVLLVDSATPTNLFEYE
ncbi:MAG: hypothetical protein K1X72_26570 [Pyrinomonadaceae bacterium]|nr:hypothetical protein [Pyrinomonadaceae bacterium]